MVDGNLSNDLRATSILFASMVIGLIVFVGISIGVNVMIGPFKHDGQFAKIFLIVTIFLSTVCLISAHINYNRRVYNMQQSTAVLQERLNQYRSALIIYLALTEGPAIFSIMGFLLTGDFRFLAITVILLVNMFIKRPSKSRFIEELQLDTKEQQGLES